MNKVKTFGLLTALIVMSFTASSQDLTPTKIEVVDGDTIFCWTIGQSKGIAKRLQTGKYCDSLKTAYKERIGLLEEENAVKDNKVGALNQKVDNLEQINSNSEEEAKLLQDAYDQQRKSIRRLKFHKVILGTAVVVLAILGILGAS